jgi:hypothetical protein
MQNQLISLVFFFYCSWMNVFNICQRVRTYDLIDIDQPLDNAAVAR